jgi:hypothetical protein
MQDGVRCGLLRLRESHAEREDAGERRKCDDLLQSVQVPTLLRVAHVPVFARLLGNFYKLEPGILGTPKPEKQGKL